MKILLAPSETKRVGGDRPFRPATLLFSELLPLRRLALDAHAEVLRTFDTDALAAFLGLKGHSDIDRYRRDVADAPAMKAIRRYTGVAFDHLDYDGLDAQAQAYIDRNLILFSNLFGVLRADDAIPDYRLQQGKSIGAIQPDRHYRPHLQRLLDAHLNGEEILDIRAGYYDRYYRPTHPYTTLRFLKNGKVISHWAKAYRGRVLRVMAQANTPTLDAFIALPIEGLHIEEIRTQKNRTEIIYSIMD